MPVSKKAKLSTNFPVWEFERSETAIRKGIANEMGEAEVAAAKELCKQVLQPARDKFGAMRINSGYRSPQLNKLLHGAKNSDHMYGKAADIVPLARYVTLRKLGKFIQDNCKFKQLIYEFGVWLHVSYDNALPPDAQKCEVLEAYKEPYTNMLGQKKTRTKYRPYKFE